MLSLFDFKNNYPDLWQQLFKNFPYTVNQIYKLSLQYPNFPIKQTLTQFDIYNKNAKKFNNVNEFLFTTKGAMQSSSSKIALYHKELFKKYSSIADICCGCGIDLQQLAFNKSKVYAIDLNLNTLEYAKFNNKSHTNIDYLNQKAEDFDKTVDAVFCDPDRRINAKRLIKPEDMQPKLSYLVDLSKKVKAMAIKLSPALDYTRLNLDINYSLQFVSHDKSLKELLLLTGDFVKTNSEREAILLDNNEKISSTENDCCKISTIQNYIYEPDPAIIRAHLIKQVANKLKLNLLCEHSAILTSDLFLTSSYVNCYKVKMVFNYKLKELNKYLKTNNIGILDIKTRGFNESVESFRKKLKLKGKSKALIFILKIKSRHLCIFAEKEN